VSDLEGRVAVVIGSRHGVGTAVARALAKESCRVLIAETDQPSSTVEESPADLPSGVERLRLSGTDPSSIRAAIGEAKAVCGRLDVLVQHHVTVYRGDALAVTADEWQRDLEVLTTYFLLSQAFAAEAEPHGSIVNIASIDFAQAYPGRSTASAVANGLVGLSRALAVEWATRPIRVNVVAPGVMLTDDDKSRIERGERSLDRVLLRAPSHRLGTADETASVVVFLAGPKADFITGQTLAVDGGWAALTQHAEGLRFP
jgi:2-deoxy-D-gluconate 3-dehydrogenase